MPAQPRTVMVFVPLTLRLAAELRDTGTLLGTFPGHSATAALLQAYGGGAGEDGGALEEAEYAALGYAAVRAVLATQADPLRLVLAVEVPAEHTDADARDEHGRTLVDGLRWADVRALFADEAAAAPAVAAARAAVGREEQPGDKPHDLDRALAEPAVQALLDEHDLLWFAPEELDQLP